MAKFLRIYRDFSGGLSESANDNIKDNQLVEARNIMPGDGYGITRAYGTTIAYPKISVSQPQMNKVVRLFEGKLYNGGTSLLAFYSVPDGLETMVKYIPSLDDWLEILDDMPAVIDCFFHAGYFYWLNGEKMRSYDGIFSEDVSLKPITGSTSTEEERALKRSKKQLQWNSVGRGGFMLLQIMKLFFLR